MLKLIKLIFHTFLIFVFNISQAEEQRVLHMVLEKGIVKIQTFPNKALFALQLEKY